MTLSALPSQSSSPADGTLRVLGSAELPELRRLLQCDPDAYCVVAERVEAGSLDAPASGGQTWGWYRADTLESAVYVGANLIPMQTSDAARVAFAARLARVGRRSSAIVGYREEVLDLWERLAPAWDRAREVRADQPLMRITGKLQVEPDPRVRLVDLSELDTLMPASVAMFTEEVGVSPVEGGRAPSYRARLAEMVRSGRAYARFDGGRIVFKAEVGSASKLSCQLQGVWVAPDLRGQGMAAPGLAAVVGFARRDHSKRVSLYANGHNAAALRAYARVGFEQIGTFATVLF